MEISLETPHFAKGCFRWRNKRNTKDYANVVIFYIYLTKDRELIEHILQNATHIYGDLAPCDLDEDVRFLNELRTRSLNTCYRTAIRSSIETNIAADRMKMRRTSPAQRKKKPRGQSSTIRRYRPFKSSTFR